jgi:U3 small nucleolar RNA-associated protein 10
MLADLFFISDDEQASQLLPHVKRRAHALVIFTAAAFEGSLSSSDTDIEGLNKLVSALLEISSSQNIPGVAGEHDNLVEIAQAARVALSECTKSMHATHFVASIASILKDGNPDERVSRGVMTETLDVFVDKLPSVSKSIREEASSNVATIVTEIKRLLPLGDESLVGAALRALKAVGSSIVPGEEGSLVDCLPLVLTALRNDRLTAAGVAALPPLWYVSSDVPLGIT